MSAAVTAEQDKDPRLTEVPTSQLGEREAEVTAPSGFETAVAAGYLAAIIASARPGTEAESVRGLGAEVVDHIGEQLTAAVFGNMTITVV